MRKTGRLPCAAFLVGTAVLVGCQPATPAEDWLAQSAALLRDQNHGGQFRMSMVIGSPAKALAWSQQGWWRHRADGAVHLESEIHFPGGGPEPAMGLRLIDDGRITFLRRRLADGSFQDQRRSHAPSSSTADPLAFDPTHWWLTLTEHGKFRLHRQSDSALLMLEAPVDPNFAALLQQQVPGLEAAVALLVIQRAGAIPVELRLQAETGQDTLRLQFTAWLWSRWDDALFRPPPADS